MHDYRDVRVLLLGATGFIGRHVAQQLRDVHADLHVVIRDRTRRDMLARAGIAADHAHACDLTDFAAVHHAIRDLAPAIVFNLASYGVAQNEREARLAERINAELVSMLCDTVAGVETEWRGQRLVHVGSALEYGAISGDLVESSEEAPTTLYGRTKLQGTTAIRDFARARGFRAITARLFTVYGPGERSERLLPTLMRATRTDEPIQLTAGLQRRDFTYVGDAAEGLLRLGTSAAAAGAVINVATGQLHTVREFVETAADILGIARDRLLFGSLPTREEEMWHLPVANQRLRELTGWTPALSIAEGIRATLAESLIT